MTENGRSWEDFTQSEFTVKRSSILHLTVVTFSNKPPLITDQWHQRLVFRSWTQMGVKCKLTTTLMNLLLNNVQYLDFTPGNAPTGSYLVHLSALPLTWRAANFDGDGALLPLPPQSHPIGLQRAEGDLQLGPREAAHPAVLCGDLGGVQHWRAAGWALQNHTVSTCERLTQKGVKQWRLTKKNNLKRHFK